MNAIRRMLAFYGYCIIQLAPTELEGTVEWKEKSQNRLSPGNHNHLRIARIFRSMCLLDRALLARLWYRSLVAVGKSYPDMVSQSTLKFWNEAVGVA